MMFTNSKGIIIATIALFYDGNRARAFVPEDTRVRIGGGRGLISTPPESLSLKECQQRSPRLSEAGFRLDYVQGVRPPQKIHAVEKDDRKKTDDDFLYGLDSTCYRGLTEPTKAGLVLALVLLSGMAVASPDFHLPSVTSLIETSRHLMGDDAASELSALVDRMAFQWDMSGVEEFIHGVSDQAALSFNNEPLPFSSQLRDNIQEVTATVSGQFDIFLAQADSQIDSMKQEFSTSIASPDAIMLRENLSQRTNEWQLASQDKIQGLQHQVAQATSNIQAGVSQALNNGRQLFEAQFASFRDISDVKVDLSELKVDQLDLDILPDSAEFRTQAVEKFARSKDAVMFKSLEYQQASQIAVDELKTGMLQTNEQLQGLADQTNQQLKGLTDHYAGDVKGLSLEKYTSVQDAITLRMNDLQATVQSEALKYREITDSFVTQKSSQLQESSQAKMIAAEQNIMQGIEGIQSRFTEVGTDFEMKARDARRDVVPFIGDLGQLLQNKALAFRDASFDAMSKVKDDAFQGRASIDTVAIRDNFQDWKDRAMNAWSSAENSITNELALKDAIQRVRDSTESIVNQVSIQDTLQDLKDSTKSVANQVSIPDSLQQMKDNTESMINQVSIQDTLQDLKDSTKSIANEVSIPDSLQQMKENTESIANQVGTFGLHPPDPAATESSFLKSVLDDVVY